MLGGLPLTLNLGLFALAAALIWWSGTRVERLTDTISRRTKLGPGVAGLLLLAVVTSLPEAATTTTAVLRGDVDLAVHNLLGGTAFQVVVLAIADAAARRGPLTRSAPAVGLLIQGVGLVFMLGLAVCGLLLGADGQFTVSLGGVSPGLNPILLALPLGYLLVVRLTRSADRDPQWQPVRHGRGDPDSEPSGWLDDRRSRRLGLVLIGLAALVLAGGWATATLADLIAAQTGLGSGVVGATLLAAATSLPEISTTVAAVRSGRQELAVSNVFGSNGFDVSLLALASVLAGSSFPGDLFTSAAFLGTVAGMLTCLYLGGLLTRSRRSVANVGLDSIAVIVVYVAGVAAVYGLG